MPILFAGLAAVLLGTSDLLAARAGRITGSLSVTRTAVGVSAVVSPLLLLVAPVTWTTRDVVIGLLSGVAMIGGLALLYLGYSTIGIGLVAPVSAVLTAGVPVAVGVVLGVGLARLVIIGMALGLVAVALTSIHGGGLAWQWRAVALGGVSGLLFGTAFTLMGEVDVDAGLAPVMMQRISGFVLLAMLGLTRSEPLFATPGLGRRWSILAGVLAAVAIGSLQWAFQHGDLGPVAVAGSQFVTVAVLLAVLVDGERLRWWQAVGVGCTAIAVAMIAIGSA